MACGALVSPQISLGLLAKTPESRIAACYDATTGRSKALNATFTSHLKLDLGLLAGAIGCGVVGDRLAEQGSEGETRKIDPTIPSSSASSMLSGLRAHAGLSSWRCTLATTSLTLRNPTSLFHTSSPVFLTLNQAIRRKVPQVKKRPTAPLLQTNPFKKGVVNQIFIAKPKKPNSAKRKVARVTLSNGETVQAYIQGEGHNLQEHSVVLVRGGRAQDLPGVRYVFCPVLKQLRSSVNVHRSPSGTNSFAARWTLEELLTGRLLVAVMEVCRCVIIPPGVAANPIEQPRSQNHRSRRNHTVQGSTAAYNRHQTNFPWTMHPQLMDVWTVRHVNVPRTAEKGSATGLYRVPFQAGLGVGESYSTVAAV